MNSYPPLFPQSKYLRSRGWHQLIRLICLVYSACSLYSFFLSFVVLLDSLGILAVGIDKTLTLPMIIPLYPLMLFSKPVAHPGTNISYPVFQDPNWGLIILMVYFFVSIFLPSIIYKFILNVSLGKKWRK